MSPIRFAYLLSSVTEYHRDGVTVSAHYSIGPTRNVYVTVVAGEDSGYTRVVEPIPNYRENVVLFRPWRMSPADALRELEYDPDA